MLEAAARPGGPPRAPRRGCAPRIATIGAKFHMAARAPEARGAPLSRAGRPLFKPLLNVAELGQLGPAREETVVLGPVVRGIAADALVHCDEPSEEATVLRGSERRGFHLFERRAVTWTCRGVHGSADDLQLRHRPCLPLQPIRQPNGWCSPEGEQNGRGRQCGGERRAG